MNIIDYPGLILTKDELWKLYISLNYVDRECIVSVMQNFYKQQLENVKEKRNNLALVK